MLWAKLILFKVWKSRKNILKYVFSMQVNISELLFGQFVKPIAISLQSLCLSHTHTHFPMGSTTQMTAHWALVIFINLMIYQPTTRSSSWWRFSWVEHFKAVQDVHLPGEANYICTWCCPCQGPQLLQPKWKRSRKGVQPPLCEASVYTCVGECMHGISKKTSEIIFILIVLGCCWGKKELEEVLGLHIIWWFQN